MCGRYATTVDPALLAVELDAIDESGPGQPDYNVAPTTPVLTVVRVPAVAERTLIRRMRWGFVAPWAEEFAAGPPLFNARAESVATKPTFRDSIQSRRCLVPMDGWYEWQDKVPLYMAPRDGSTLFMAGVWSLWGGQRPSVAMLTTDSVGPLRQVHDRMPLILARADWARWLDPAAGLEPALLAQPSAEIAESVGIRRVSRQVNSVRNNGPHLLDPDQDEPEQLTLL
ncbi:SOS response-associated peptidase [Tomitella biformata]|uniref:SOS response-associated peptidase n=1 Tax=Tomitella biformata TaxID=630403 RepID=UPI0004677A31|nr:SOS response-associated peptidase [Tomitella biformata]